MVLSVLFGLRETPASPPFTTVDLSDALQSDDWGAFEPILSRNTELLFQADERGRTLLMRAVQSGKVQVIRGYLANLRGDRRLLATDAAGNTLLHLACEGGQSGSLCALFEERIDIAVDEINGGGFTPLLWIFEKHEKETDELVKIVEMLLEHGAEPRRPGPTEGSLLQRACSKGFEKIAQLLITAGVQFATGENPKHHLSTAIQRRQGLLFQLMLNLGATIREDALNGSVRHYFTLQPELRERGGTWLHYWASMGHTESLSAALGNIPRSFFDVPDFFGCSPMMLAAANCHFRAVQILLDKGADYTLTARSGNNCLHFIATFRHVLANEPSPAHEAVVVKRQDPFLGSHVNEFLTSLCRLPGLLDQPNEKSMTPLALACQVGNTAFTSILLNAQAETNARDFACWTPLHHAAQGNHVECARLLLAAQADVNARTRLGETALHFSVQHDTCDVTQLLIGAGGNINSPDEGGKTPFHKAEVLEKTAQIDYLTPLLKSETEDKTPPDYNDVE